MNEIINFNGIVHKDKSYFIIGAAMEVHKVLGCGFLESVYQEALAMEPTERHIPYEREKQLDIYYKGILLDKKFYADFICYDDIILEIKAVTELIPVHRAQLLNYLKATKKRLGILINFGETSLRYERYANTRSHRVA